jgi:hypothetical protein
MQDPIDELASSARPMPSASAWLRFTASPRGRRHLPALRRRDCCRRRPGSAARRHRARFLDCRCRWHGLQRRRPAAPCPAPGFLPPRRVSRSQSGARGLARRKRLCKAQPPRSVPPSTSETRPFSRNLAAQALSFKSTCAIAGHRHDCAIDSQGSAPNTAPTFLAASPT